MTMMVHPCSKQGLHDAPHASHKADPHTPMNGLLGFHVQYHSSRLEMASQEICKIHLDFLPTNMKMKYEMKIQILKEKFCIKFRTC
jgi:hypothetical protein